MARSTQNSPTPFQSHSTRSQHRRPPPRVILSNSDDDADESGSSEACAAVQPSARPPRFISLSDSSDDEEDGTTDTDANLMSEDEVYLQDLAQATQLKAAHLSQQLHSPGENREKLLAKLLDSAKRSDLRMKKFSEFIHPRDRQILDVPKKVHKDFEKTRAKKFLDLEGSDEEVDDMMDVDSDDDDHDDSERDDHEGQASDSESEQDTFDHSNLDPLLIDVDNNQEPPRAPRGGVKLRQRLLKNFGPNQYMLRIVSMDQFGGGDKRRNTLFKVCPRCGYRFDGEKPDVGTPAHHVLQRAILVAREQVATLQEVVDLPSS